MNITLFNEYHTIGSWGRQHSRSRKWIGDQHRLHVNNDVRLLRSTMGPLGTSSLLLQQAISLMVYLPDTTPCGVNTEPIPDSKVYGANMGPIWGRQDPVGPHVGPLDFTIWGCFLQPLCTSPLIYEITNDSINARINSLIQFI